MSNEALMRDVILTAEVCGTTLGKAPAAVMVAELEAHPLAAVSSALAKCRREITGRLSLAHILARIDDGRPGADEAWTMCPRDEDATIVWTEEMAEAFDAARHELELDPVSARMAFKSAYQRICEKARDAGMPVRWIVSLGHDKNRIASTVLDALQMGRISANAASEYIHAGLPDFERAEQRLRLLTAGKRPELGGGAQEAALKALTDKIGKNISGMSPLTPEQQADLRAYERERAK